MDEKPIIKRLVVGSLSANCFIAGKKSTGEGLVIDPGETAMISTGRLPIPAWILKSSC